MSNNNSNSNSDLPILTHHVVDKSQVGTFSIKQKSPDQPFNVNSVTFWQLIRVDLLSQHKKVPSIDQKRMLAFINHFILNTVDFLNKFIANCETKFIEFDTKLQKIESSLVIVESKVQNANTIFSASTQLMTMVSIFSFSVGLNARC